MKKFPFIVMAAVAMISCGNTYTAKNAALGGKIDSLNYALGLVNGAQIRMYYMQQDTSAAMVDEFMEALTAAYEGKTEEKTDAQRVGENIGYTAKQFETKGLAEKKEWGYNGKVFLQALVNGLYGEKAPAADSVETNWGEWFQQQYYAAQPDSTQKPKYVKASCPAKAKQLKLKTLSDSLNYALGWLNGEQISAQVIGADTTGTAKKAFINAVNTGLKSGKHNPQLIGMAENIGKTIAEQEETGLLGVEGVPTLFSLIQQGFTNGLSGYDKQMTMQEAGEYVNKTLDELRYGDVKAQGEQFLEENKLKEGVVVTESGLQYEVLRMGKGQKPQETDRVKVHYHGTLIDGTVFDSSVERGEPITFGLNQVIKGWTEGVQLMPVGSKFRFYIPQELGYGSQKAGQIPPYSTLIFEVELLGIEK